MLYQIITMANEWNRWGAPINVRELSRVGTNDPVEAGKAVSNQNTKLWGAKHHQHVEVRDVHDKIVEHVELYAATIGTVKFAAQYADESFSINLDDFFRSL